MHHELNITPEETIYYRYNPEADVLALRLAPTFGPAVEDPLPDLPDVTLSRDAATGDPVGLRIAGVQQFILNSLIREVFSRARPYLESQTIQARGGSAAGGAASALAAAPSPSTGTASAAVGAVAAAWAGEDREANDGRRRGRRRRKKKHAEASEADTLVVREAPTEASVDDDSEVAEMLTLGAGAAAAAVTLENDAFDSDAGAIGDDVPGSETIGDEGIGDDAMSAPASGDRRRRRRRRGGRELASAESSEIDEAEIADAGVIEDDGAADGPVVPVLTAEPFLQSEPETVEPAYAAEVEPELEPEYFEPDYVESEPKHVDVESEYVEPSGFESAPVDRAPARNRDLPGSSGSFATPTAFASVGLDERLGQAIAAMGFTTPTPIQAEAVPVAMSGRDVIGLAQTGTGKTLAFVVPGLNRILADPNQTHRPRMLILAPTRELTVQVALEAERLARFTDLRVTTIYGGVGMEPQTRALKQGTDVIVATPGRMLDHVRRGNVRLGEVGVLVLDEADRMLDMGFLPDVRTALRFLPRERQTMLFTATMPPEIESLSMEFQREPVLVEIARRKPPESIEQLLYPVGKHLKAPLLIHLLLRDRTMTSVLVFTERKIDADVLARQLRQSGIKLALMHGDRRQVDRERALAALKNGSAQVLVATNVAARGLDIDDISHVVNYDCPQTVDEYVHRIGRTARAEALGKAYTFVTHSDETMIMRIEDALDRKLPRVLAEGFDYDVPTPNWAKPSAKDVMAMLDRQTSVVDRLRGLGRR